MAKQKQWNSNNIKKQTERVPVLIEYGGTS